MSQQQQQLLVKGPPPAVLKAKMPVGKKPPPPRAPRIAPAAPLAPAPGVQGTLPSPRGPNASGDRFVTFGYVKAGPPEHPIHFIPTSTAVARGGGDGPDDAPTHEDGQRSGEDGSSDHGEDREEQYAFMMVDVSSDSIDLDGEDFERLVPFFEDRRARHEI